MTILKKIISSLFIAVLVLVAGLAGIIIYALISDYKPPEKTVIAINETLSKLSDSITFSLLTWNIGYCGLDRYMDFFYDGGIKVFTPKRQCEVNLAAVEKFIKGNDSMDFIFIQEIDKKSRRSYFINEYDSLVRIMQGYWPFFGKNYDVFFVPFPPSSPMGKVLSGLATFSRYQPSSSIRYSLPGEYGFPKQLFMLDRCFLVNRYPLQNGKELIIINTHNEAFDRGQIRKAQMNYLKDLLLNEYQNGNYIIAGGDWNQTPPGFKPDIFVNVSDTTQMPIPSDFIPNGWEWLYDNKTPSERNVVTAYDQTKTPTTIFDFFLVSPNIKAVTVEGIPLNFENSDHNPVRIKVKLLK
jgi:endonuclease/exonuclease/phosphatase family metal-dependent hydrolase